MHPVFFQIGDFTIAWYGVLMACGLLFGIMVAVVHGRRAGFDDAVIVDLALVAMIGTLIGARLLYIAVEYRAFAADPLGHIFSRRGFVFLGGLAGALALCAWMIARRRLPFWRLADVFAPAIPLGHAIGRIGCHLTGCCFGGVCAADAWYGLRVPLLLDAHGEVLGGHAVLEQIDLGLLPSAATLSLPVYPVQLFEAAGVLLLAGAVAWMLVRRPAWPGRAFLAYLIGYSALRFGLEFLRGDAARGVFHLGIVTLSSSQILSLGFAALGLWAWHLGRSGRLPGQLIPVPIQPRHAAVPVQAKEPKQPALAPRTPGGAGARRARGRAR